MSNSKKFQIQAAEDRSPMKNGDLYETQLNIDAEPDCDDDKYAKPKQPHWLLQRIFILSWIRSYDREKAIADLIAGITVGLTIIPQSIAYAALAGLSSEYGLYSAFIGSVIYVFFGTIPQVSIGPTSLMSLLVLQYCADKPVQIVIVLAFLAGLVEFLMGVFRLGFIISFIPAPVVKAFTTATAGIVFVVQIKNLLGVKIKGLLSVTVFWNNINLPDAIIGISCFIILIALRQLSHINFKNNNATTRRIKKILWYISIARNALLVCSCSAITYFWVQKSSREAMPYALSAKVDSAIVTVRLPPFVFESQNVTYGFTDICRELGSGIIIVPIVAILANVAIAKAFVKDGQLDASQEMLTLGICNMAGSFFSAMPTCGAFTRSAVNQASGVRTPMAGIYTGMLVLSALCILTPYFQFIPKSSLAAVLMAAVMFMVDFSPFMTLWHTNKKDFFSWVGCLLVCLLADVQVGLFFGIIVNMVFILLRLGNPKLDIRRTECDGVNYIHVMPISDIYYTGVDSLRNEIREVCCLYRYDFPVLVDCSRFIFFDATFIEMINAVAKELQEKNMLLILYHMREELQEVMPLMPNIRYCNDALSGDDFALKI